MKVRELIQHIYCGVNLYKSNSNNFDLVFTDLFVGRVKDIPVEMMDFNVRAVNPSLDGCNLDILIAE